MRLTVAKVGGSLFDLSDLRDRLLRWAGGVPAERILLVPGGGEAADVVRRLDHMHHLSEATAHWLALRTTAVNAHFLAALLGIPVVESADERAPSRIAVLDPYSFCREDDGRPGAVEHSWRVTSDTVAARVAAVAAAPLVLLKSVDLPDGYTWQSAGSAGLVDEAFGDMARRHGVAVSWVNLRRPEFAPPR